MSGQGRVGVHRRALQLLDDYFQQWLFLEERPTITPEDF
jgi:hypothetical protein